jgi:hypothetical protein
MNEFDLSIESVLEEVLEKPTLFQRPELINHPNIPKPMHGIAPRTLIKGKEWNEIRREAYAKNNYHCWACGVHRNFDLVLNKFIDDSGTLDAHESYVIDYEKKTVELKEIVALCKNCHNYIHSGRMNAMYDKGELDEEDCWIISTHGDSVLIDGGLIPCKDADDRDYASEWGEWKLLFRGKEYGSKWKDYQEWEEHYGV